LGGQDVGVAVNPKTNTIYVANSFSPSVSVISGRTDTVTATIPAGFFAGPYGVAVNPKTNTVYVTGLGSKLSVISGRTNAITARIRLPGANDPGAITANPKTSTVYVANLGSSTVSVLAPCPR
jgi:YVTN family beta-propeller protein